MQPQPSLHKPESLLAACTPLPYRPLLFDADNADAETAGEVTQVLLELGADVNGRRAGGRTPLMEACSFAQSAAVAEAVMKPLLNAGADVNAADEGGWTACAYAATNPSQETAVAALRLLAAHSADMNRPAKDGRTALSIAACQLEWRNLPAVLACGAGDCEVLWALAWHVLLLAPFLLLPHLIADDLSHSCGLQTPTPRIAWA